MTNIIPFDFGNAAVALPDYLRQFDLSDDLSRGVSQGFPTISFKGKAFSINRGGEHFPLTRTNDDGEEEEVRYIDAVIIKASPHIAKVYYPGAYAEGSDAKPTCFSNDGITPSAEATNPECTNCAMCPRNQWGSRITDEGKKGKECRDSRRLAIAALDQLNDPMLLRVSPTALKPLAEYNKLLRLRGVPYYVAVTRIGFEKGVAHPSLIFKPVGLLNQQQAAEVIEMQQSDLVAQITGLEELADRPTPEARPAAPATRPVVPKPAAPKPTLVAAVEEVDEEPEAPAPAPKPKAVAKPKPKPALQATVEEPEDVAPASDLNSKLSGAFGALLGAEFDD